MSGIAMIQVAESGENSIVIAAGANAYLDESLVEEQAENIRQADALLMQLETLLAAICYDADIAKTTSHESDSKPSPGKHITANVTC